MEEEKLLTFIGIGNQLRYRCPEYPQCRHNYYREDMVLKHWVECHAPPSGAGPTLFDAEDKPLKVDKVLIPKALQKFI